MLGVVQRGQESLSRDSSWVFKMKWRDRTLDEIAELVCGNGPDDATYFPYRSSYYLTRFFRDADTDYAHDGSTRSLWVATTLAEILNEPHPNAQTPPDTLCRVIRTLMDPADARNEGAERSNALAALNIPLSREGFEAFYASDNQCYLRHIGTNTVAAPAANPHRPLSKLEIERRDWLNQYLDQASEDELIEEVLLPLFRQLGFHRITAAGHRDKALEYGKDVWMKYTLPTQHILYFGIQAKRGKLDASGVSGAANSNVAEIHNQVTMMLGHEIFDPEVSRRVLVDHAFIVAGGQITKAARNWIGGKLDQTKRSQIMFMDREDILNLFIVTNLPLPTGAVPQPAPKDDDEIPF
ncbi:MAG: hypothetical protein Q7S93_03195 [Phenylobacterium sp.]|nr:hypothetical protein [Phenylobacterium sp.]